jgi:hypothetical protein
LVAPGRWHRLAGHLVFPSGRRVPSRVLGGDVVGAGGGESEMMGVSGSSAHHF